MTNDMPSDNKKIFAKKSLGQHYLSDKNAIEKIAAAVPENIPLLLEIGPGRGAITTSIYNRAEHFCVLEKDDFLFEKIQETLRIEGKERFLAWNEDALSFDYGKVWSETGLSETTPLVVASNLPYNIATEILLRLLRWEKRIPFMVLMFQKEVGQRLAANPNSKAYGSLSVITQNFYHVEVLQILKPGAFRPPPKVDSIVLTFSRKEKPVIDFVNEEEFLRFEKLVRALFAYRRKTLENNLKIAGGKLPWKLLHNKEGLQEFLSAVNMDGIRRAETLSLEDFSRLFRYLEKTKAGPL